MGAQATALRCRLGFFPAGWDSGSGETAGMLIDFPLRALDLLAGFPLEAFVALKLVALFEGFLPPDPGFAFSLQVLPLRDLFLGFLPVSKFKSLFSCLGGLKVK